jgi:hypothetical protein
MANTNPVPDPADAALRRADARLKVEQQTRGAKQSELE